MSRQAKSQRHGAVIIAAVSLAGVLGNAMVAPALPDIARALSVDDTGIGLVVAAASLPGVVVAPIIGVAADRLGRRAVVVPCLVVFGLGGLAAMAAPNFGVLIAARFGQGFGAAGLVNLAVVMIGDRHDDPVSGPPPSGATALYSSPAWPCSRPSVAAWWLSPVGGRPLRPWA